ncbi:MAG TPA: hypothetical protein VGE40_05700, partial [Bacilli bacterium]
ICPHCFNELDGYRSIHVGLKKPLDTITLEEEALRKKWLEDDEDDELYDLDQELVELETGYENLLAYEENLLPFLMAQEYSMECTICRESMVYAGEQKVPGNQFIAAVPEGVTEPFLSAPFTVKVHVCPTCFKMEHSLSEEDRIRIMNNLNK